VTPSSSIAADLRRGVGIVGEIPGVIREASKTPAATGRRVGESIATGARILTEAATGAPLRRATAPFVQGVISGATGAPETVSAPTAPAEPVATLPVREPTPATAEAPVRTAGAATAQAPRDNLQGFLSTASENRQRLLDQGGVEVIRGLRSSIAVNDSGTPGGQFSGLELRQRDLEPGGIQGRELINRAGGSEAIGAAQERTRGVLGSASIRAGAVNQQGAITERILGELQSGDPEREAAARQELALRQEIAGTGGTQVTALDQLDSLEALIANPSLSDDDRQLAIDRRSELIQLLPNLQFNR
jgi:hypothetical protein